MLKLLIVKTSSLGDIIHNLPIITDIRAHDPSVEIDWLVEHTFADIPKLHPIVQNVITVDTRRWRKGLFKAKTWREIRAFSKRLGLKQYDMILDTQGLLKSSLMAFSARGVKHGYDAKSIREPLASFFYNQKHTVAKKQHAVARNRALAAKAFGYAVPNSLPQYGIEASSDFAVSMPSPYVIGFHGTSRDSKLWPTDHWIALGLALNAQGLHLALPWATVSEFDRANIIASVLPNATVLPKYSLAHLASIISQSKAAIGVDTGLSHLSVALNVLTIALYTDTDPMLTGVYAGDKTPAINLGNINHIPSVDAVMNALQDEL
jgi:heptosyltransferase I